MPDVTTTTRRIGHKGADHISPGNTIASFEAALAQGVDMIEFDVLPEHYETRSGKLLLAHDYKHLAAHGAIELHEGLAHFATDAYAGVELDVDLKLTGYEQRVVDALREHGLAERTLISTMEMESLRELRRIAPEIRLGRSVPQVKRNYLANPLTKPLAMAAVLYARRTLARELAAQLRAGEIDAVMSHYALVTPAFWAAIRDAGGELYVWTVDDAARIAELEAMGVTGVITNDPRLFTPRA